MKTLLQVLLALILGSTATSAIAQIASPAPAKTVYTARLPTPQEITTSAPAQGVTVESIEQTSTELTVTYKSTNGQLTTVCYQVLPAAGAPASTAPVISAPPPEAQTVVVSAPPPTTTVIYRDPPPPQVIYAPAPVYYYSEPYPYYRPWGYPNVVVGVGFGYRGHYRR